MWMKVEEEEEAKWSGCKIITGVLFYWLVKNGMKIGIGEVTYKYNI